MFRVEVAFELLRIYVVLVLLFQDYQVLLQLRDCHEVLAVVVINVVRLGVDLGPQVFFDELSFAEALPENEVQVSDVLIGYLVEGVLALFVLDQGVRTFGDSLDVLSDFPLDVGRGLRKVNLG